MKPQSYVFYDTNICIDRTLSLVKPKIYNDYLHQVRKKIAELTNNNLSCEMVLPNIVISELENKEILFKEIRDFCVNKLHEKRGYKIMQKVKSAEKSLSKFVNKYRINPKIKKLTKNYKKNNLEKIKKLYKKFPKRLDKLTKNKCKQLGPKEKEKKKKQRKDNLPEKNDMLLLAQAMELNKNVDNNVAIFSRDKDFKEFGNEIESELGVEIIYVQEK